MKRTIISIIVAGLFAVIGGTAVAQNVTAGDQPAAAPEAKAAPANPGAKAPKTGMTKHHRAKGADTSDNADYKAAKGKAQAEYKAAKAKCDNMQGDAMRTCMSEAKTARTQALAEARTQWGTQGGAKDGLVDPSKSPSKGMKSDTSSAIEPEPVMQKASDRSGQPEANEDPVAKTSATSGTNESPDRSGQPTTGESASETEAIKSGTNEPADRGGQPETVDGAVVTETIKVEKMTAHEAAHAGYKVASLKCDTLRLTGAARLSCLAAAEKARTDALAEADREPGAPASRMEKAPDVRSDDDSENYRNVSTARKPVDGDSATQ